jgi:hypothetical protein
MKDLIKTVQQGLQKDLLRAKEMINNEENDYVVSQHLMESLEIVNKQLVLLTYEPQIDKK